MSPSQTFCHPPPSPKTPDPLVPKPRPALVLTVSREMVRTFIHVSMEEAEDVATGHIAWMRSKGSWSLIRLEPKLGPAFSPVGSWDPGFGGLHRTSEFEGTKW